MAIAGSQIRSSAITNTHLGSSADIAWSKIDMTGSSLADLATKDHGDLTGRDDDDHTIYSLADGTRAFTGAVAGVDPSADADLTTKSWVETRLKGLDPQESVTVLNVIDDVIGTPPGSPDEGDTYLIDPDTDTAATGAWAGWDGHWTYYNGTAWQDLGAAAVDDRAIVDASPGAGGGLNGHAKKIATITAITIGSGGSVTWSMQTANSGWHTFIESGYSSGRGWRYNGTSWEVYSQLLLASAAPNDCEIGSAAVGTASKAAREDHVHSASTGTPTGSVAVQSNDEGSASSFARSDHAHNLSVAAPTNIGSSNDEGSATSTVRSDHVHQLRGGYDKVNDAAGDDTGMTLSNTPLSAALALIFKNGIKMEKVDSSPTGEQYTISGTTVSFAASGESDTLYEAHYPY